MDVRFADTALERVFQNREFDGGYGPFVAGALRRRIHLLKSVRDEKDLLALASVELIAVPEDLRTGYLLRLDRDIFLKLHFEDRESGRQAVVNSMCGPDSPGALGHG